MTAVWGFLGVYSAGDVPASALASGDVSAFGQTLRTHLKSINNNHTASEPTARRTNGQKDRRSRPSQYLDDNHNDMRVRNSSGKERAPGLWGLFICIYFIAFFFLVLAWLCCSGHLWNDIETVLCCWFSVRSSIHFEGNKKKSERKKNELDSLLSSKLVVALGFPIHSIQPPEPPAQWTVRQLASSDPPPLDLTPRSPDRNTHSLIYSPAGRKKSGFLLLFL